MIEGRTPFLERAHRIAIGLGVVSLVFGLVWGVISDDVDYVTTHGANGYSRSALGFHALGELLQARGIEVVRSRFRSRQRADPADVLLLASPDAVADDSRDREILDAILTSERRVLLVLPKWDPDDANARGRSDDVVHYVRRVADTRVSRLLADIDPDARVASADGATFPVNALGAAPDIAHPQVLRDSELMPLVYGDEGLLIGEQRRREGRLVVLSDPEPLSNSGLGRGENAALALALIDALRGEGGRVVFDETLHGLERIPSVWGEFIRRPFRLGSAHVVLLFVAAIVAGAVRFGRPRRVDGGLREGKEALLENIAELLERVGHAPTAVGRYFDVTVDGLADALHAPRSLTRAGRLDWLASRLPPARGDELRALTKEVLAPDDPATRRARRLRRAALLALAVRIHRFRDEVVHGAR